MQVGASGPYSEFKSRSQSWAPGLLGLGRRIVSMKGEELDMTYIGHLLWKGNSCEIRSHIIYPTQWGHDTF